MELRDGGAVKRGRVLPAWFAGVWLGMALAGCGSGTAFAGDAGEEEKKAIRREIRGMLSGTFQERRAASHALSDRGRACLPQVLELWRSCRWDARTWGIRTVARMGKPVAEMFPRFLEVAKTDKEGFVRGEALAGAVTIAGNAPEVRAAVLAAMKDRSPEVRLRMVQVLAAWSSERGDGGKPAAAALRRLLHDPDALVRLNAVYNWRSGPGEPEREIVELGRSDPDPQVRLYARNHVSWYPDSVEVAKVLLAGLQDRDSNARFFAYRQMATFCRGPAEPPVAEVLVPGLASRLADPDPERRIAVLGMLTRLGPSAQTASAAIRVRQRDKVEAVRRAADDALRAVGGENGR